MKKLSLFALLVAALMVLSQGSARAAGSTVTVNVPQQGNSGDNAVATLTDAGNNQTRVVLQMQGTMPMDHNHPMHIHKGTCATLDPTPAYPLNPVTNGHSDTVVPVALASLMAGQYAINLHESPTQMSLYVACGEIKALTTGNTGGGMTGGNMSGGSMPGGNMSGGSMPASGNGDLPLLAGLVALCALLLSGAGLALRRTRS